MARILGIGVALSSLLAATAALAGGPATQAPYRTGRLLGPIGPVGGCDPDGGGLLHWWRRDCLLPPCGPDDYCPKPLPTVRCSPRPLGMVPAKVHPWSHVCPTCNRVH